MSDLGEPIKKKPAKGGHAQSAKKPKETHHPEASKALQERQRQELAKKQKEEKARKERLEQNQALNAEKKRQQEERQQQLQEKRILKQKENLEKIFFLQQRAQNTFDKVYTAYQQLQKSDVVDPSIFDGSPKFVDVQKALAQADISVTEHIHGNEQCVALWKDVQNKKHMFWFHKPHGVQDKKGEDAGWCRGLEHKLRETGMLAAR